MRSALLSALLGLMLFSIQAAPITFGGAVDKTQITPVADIIAEPAAYLEKSLTIEGKIQAVCQKRGCWMTLAAADNEPTFRIKVRDGDMEFPISAKGKTAYATGSVTAQSLNMAATIDYYEELAEKQGKTFDPASVTETLTFYQFTPTAVEISE